MKHITMITLAFVLLAGRGFAGSDLLLDKTFGLTEKVVVLDYKGKEKSVKVRTDDVISMRSLDSFPAAAQKEIRAWVADETFEASSGLRVRINERSKETDTDNGETEQVVYIVEMENRGEVALDEIRVQAVVFYEKHKDETEQKCRMSQSARINIPAGKEYIFTSRPVIIRDEIIKYEAREDSSRTPPNEYIEDELNGMVLILTRVDRNGEPVVREFKKGRPPKPEARPDYH